MCDHITDNEETEYSDETKAIKQDKKMLVLRAGCLLNMIDAKRT